MPYTALPLEYRRAQYIDARDKELEAGVEKLLESLRKKLKLRSVGDLERQIEALRAKLDAFKHRHEQLREEQRQLNLRKNGWELERGELKADLEESQLKLHQAEREVARLAQARAELEAQLNNALSQASDADEALQERLKTLQDENIELASALLESRERITRSQKRFDDVLSENGRLQIIEREKNQLAIALTQTKQQVSELDAQNQGLKRQLVQVQDKLTEINTQSPTFVFIHELGPTNPLNWFQLLWWVFFAPEKINNYKKITGNYSLEKLVGG
jgi:chromosome segregation ATPase